MDIRGNAGLRSNVQTEKKNEQKAQASIQRTGRIC